MEQEFLDWYESNEKRFEHGQFTEKEIAYSAWLYGTSTLTKPEFPKKRLPVRYFIYAYYKSGNVGGNSVRTIADGQPKNGFATEQEAEERLTELILAKKGYFFERDWYKFTILKTWSSLSAV